MATGDRPSGTVTFLFTDIVDSTRLWEAHPDEMRQALVRHEELLRAAIDAHGGHVFATGGDGMAVAFARAGDAVAAAVEAQRALQGETWPPAVPLRVRMGAHTGDAQERDGDYFGPPVNRAARIGASGHGGQIVISAVTAGLLGASSAITLLHLGTHSLKGVAEPIALYGVTAPDLVWPDVPLSTASAHVAGNLPRPLTEWIGPAAALARRAADLPQRRLVTLTGTGGVGKTRTAIEVGWITMDEFAGGVWFADLAPVADPDSVVAAVATTLGVQPQPGMSTAEGVLDWLRDRRVLLILDNCEHVMAPVSELAAAVVAACPTVTMLATSREPLGVAGERVVPVPSLAVGDGVALFCDRARAADESVVFGPEDMVAIGEICRRLDGIPLAIELAAARVRSAAPADLLARLNDRFRVLRSSGRGGLERHQTLRATVTWSYQLLTPVERLLFDRLSVFAGSFDLSAVEAVCCDDEVDELDAIDLLDSLVDKSMVNAERGPGGTTYRLLEMLRAYGEERLEESGGTVPLRDRHLAYYAAEAMRTARLWESPRQLDADARFDEIWDNLRASFDWALVTEEIDAATAILAATSLPATSQGRHEMLEWYLRLLELDGPERPLVPEVFGLAASFVWRQGDTDRAVALARTGISRAEPGGAAASRCYAMLVGALLNAGETEEARVHVPRLREFAATHQNPIERITALQILGLDLGGDPHEVAHEVEECERLAASVGAPSLMALAKFQLAQYLHFAALPRDGRAARAAYATAARAGREGGDRSVAIMGTAGVAAAAAANDDADTARLCRAALEEGYEARHWIVIWWLAEQAIAFWLARAGRLEEAGTIYGHVGRLPMLWDNRLANRLREEGLARVAAHPDANAFLARGAAMRPDEIVRLMFDALADPGPSMD